MLPFYRKLDLPVKAVLTDNGREFCGSENHPYELYLDLNGIEHRRTKVRSPKTNGFVERFNRTVLDEFFRVKMRETFYETVEALQADLDDWLVHYDLRPDFPPAFGRIRRLMTGLMRPWFPASILLRIPAA